MRRSGAVATRDSRHLGARTSRRLAWALFLASVLGATPHAGAEPTLEVRGRMRLELERVDRAGHGLVVTGLLLDEALGEPMAGWTVALRLGRQDELGRETFVYGHAAPVDLEGVFHFEVPNLPRARYVVHLSAPGDLHVTEPAPIDREIDLARRAIELRLFVPSEQPATLPTLPVVIEAVALDRGASASIGADAPREPELAVDLDLDGRAVATVLLKDGRGSISLMLPPGVAGRELALRVQFPGDETRSAAEATARIRLVEPATLVLAAEPGRVGAGGEVTLSGHLRFGARSSAGLPVLVRRIASVDEDGAVQDGDSTVALTAPDGSFVTSLRAPRQGNRASFEASFSSAEAKPRGLSPASSELAVVEILPRLSWEGLTRRATGTALLVSGLLVLAVLGLRLIGALWRRRLAARQLPAEVAAAALPRIGVAQRILGTLRISADRRVGGRVADADRGRPLPGVHVELRAGGSQLQRITDEEGRYDFGEHPAGPVELRFSRSGFLSTMRRGELPHRGELAALGIALVPVRAQLLRLYSEALAPYLPAREQLGPRTPRELESLVLARPPRAPLDRAALTAMRQLVEEACFGEDGAQPERLRQLAREVDRLRPPGG